MRSTGSSGWLRMAAGLALGVASIAAVGAMQPPPDGPPDGPMGQPGEPPPGQGQPPMQGPGRTRGGEGIPTDAAGLKDFFARRLEEARANVIRLEELIAELNKGGNITDLRKRFEEFRGERRQNGPQRGNGGGMPGREGGPEGERPEGGERRGGEGLRGLGEILPIIGGPKLSPEEHTRVAEMLRTEAPALHAKIQDLAGKNPQAADRLIDGMGARMRGLLGVREHDPDEFKLRMQELEGSLDIMKYKGELESIRKAGGDETKTAAAKSSLLEAVGRQFDLRMQLNARQVVQIRNHADKLQTEIDKAKTEKQKIVDETVDKLLKPRRVEGERGGKPPASPGGPRPPGPNPEPGNR